MRARGVAIWVSLAAAGCLGALLWACGEGARSPECNPCQTFCVDRTTKEIVTPEKPCLSSADCGAGQECGDPKKSCGPGFDCLPTKSKALGSRCFPEVPAGQPTPQERSCLVVNPPVPTTIPTPGE